MAIFPTLGNKTAGFFAGNDTPYNNSSALLGVGLGLLSGKTAQDQVGQAASNFYNERQMGRTYNKTLQFLQQNSPELAQAVQSGALGPADAYKLYHQEKLQAQKPVKAFSLQTLPDGTYGNYDAETGTFSALGKAAKAGPGGGEYGLNVIYGTDPETGETVLGQVGKDGSFHKVETGGFKPVGSTSNLNLGTTFQTRDRAGNVLYSTPIDNAGAASDTKLGVAQGDARAAYNSMASKMPGLESVVTKLDNLSEKATYTAAGQMLDLGRKQLGMDPREAAVARAEYISTVDNQVLPLLRDTFGAAFTQKEGDTLRATLGDPDKSPQEKQIVLKSFIEQKRRDLSALGTQAGQQPAPAGILPSPQGGQPSVRRYNPATGRIE